MRARVRVVAGAVALASLVPALGAGGQSSGTRVGLIDAGSRDEQLVADWMAGPARIAMSVRPFSGHATDSLLSAARARGFGWERNAGIRRARSTVAAWYNSSRAGFADVGPVWVGRGATLAASSGVEASVGAFSVAIRPVAFWAENRPYQLLANVAVTPGDYQSPWLHGRIDMPFRFGDKWYGRVDPGVSYARVDTRLLGVGASTAAQIWGPARLTPLVLGPNSAGMPHVFLETGLPWNVGLGRLTGRWIAGRLDASDFAPPPLVGTNRRALIGAVGSLTPRGLDGLELGVTRVFLAEHSPGAYDLQSLLQPFGALLKNRLRSSARESNQLASAFVRIAPPRLRIEMYGEFMRDDHNAHMRDLAAEPDHDAAYVIGLRYRGGTPSMPRTLTIENLNSRFSHLVRLRNQAAPYQHTPLVSGHTNRGLVLGSTAAIGGGGLLARWEMDRPRGAWRVDGGFLRVAQDQEGGAWQGKITGRFLIGVTHSRLMRAGVWTAGIDLEPGAGHLRTTNLQVRGGWADRF